MDWWKKAALTVFGVSGVSWSVHWWNEGYRQRGETHPITAFLEPYITVEEDDRQKRIAEMSKQARLADRRLVAIYKSAPFMLPDHIREEVNEKAKMFEDERRAGMDVKE